MAGIRRRSAVSEATTFVHGTLPAAYLQLDDVFGVYQEESVRIRPFDLGQSARAVSECCVIQALEALRARPEGNPTLMIGPNQCRLL
jgi:hypothetical protein